MLAQGNHKRGCAQRLMGGLLLLRRQCLKSTAPVSWDKADTAVAAGGHHLTNTRYADSIQEDSQEQETPAAGTTEGTRTQPQHVD